MIFDVRTTLTIEQDVEFGLRQMQNAEPDKPFKVLVNEILRKGLQAGSKSNGNVPFKVRARPIGLREDLNFDNIEEVLDVLEGVDRR